MTINIYYHKKMVRFVCGLERVKDVCRFLSLKTGYFKRDPAVLGQFCAQVITILLKRRYLFDL